MGDGLLALLRVAHGLTAAVWLGISLVAVLSPPALAAARAAGGLSLRGVAQTALWALVVSGAILMLDRLADPAVSTLYVALLGLKLALVAAMGLLGLIAPAAGPDESGWRRWLGGARRERVLLGLGVGAYVLGSLLTSAYEAVLRGA
jgi:xanthine/uracil permease